MVLLQNYQSYISKYHSATKVRQRSHVRAKGVKKKLLVSAQCKKSFLQMLQKAHRITFISHRNNCTHTQKSSEVFRFNG